MRLIDRFRSSRHCSKDSPQCLRVLHVSDPHFGPACHFRDGTPEQCARECVDDLERALAGHPRWRPFDLVLLTGDIIWGAGEREQGWKAGVEFIRTLIRRGFAMEEAVVVLPGNHDIVKTGLRDQLAAEREYRDFLHNAFSDGRVSSDLGYCWVSPTRQLALLGLNSCRAQAEETPGLGYVGYDQLWSQMRLLRHHLQGARSPVVLAALHHHLHPIRSLPLTHFCQPVENRHLSLTSGLSR